MSEFPAPKNTDELWRRHAVVSQISPRSFADSNGDGVGDLGGIRARLAGCSDRTASGNCSSRARVGT